MNKTVLLVSYLPYKKPLCWPHNSSDDPHRVEVQCFGFVGISRNKEAMTCEVDWDQNRVEVIGWNSEMTVVFRRPASLLSPSVRLADGQWRKIIAAAKYDDTRVLLDMGHCEVVVHEEKSGKTNSIQMTSLNHYHRYKCTNFNRNLIMITPGYFYTIDAFNMLVLLNTTSCWKQELLMIERICHIKAFRGDAYCLTEDGKCIQVRVSKPSKQKGAGDHKYFEVAWQELSLKHNKVKPESAQQEYSYSAIEVSQWFICIAGTRKNEFQVRFR